MIINNNPWLNGGWKESAIRSFTVSVDRDIHIDRTGAPVPGTKKLSFRWFTDDSLDPHEIILVGQQEIDRYFDYKFKGDTKKKSRTTKKGRQGKRS